MPLTFTHILVPTDFSENANLALEAAADLAQTYRAKLTAVYVIPQVIFHPDWATDLEETIDLDDITDEARQALLKMTEPYRQKGLDISAHVLSGGPYVEVVRMAEQLRVDLIVMGAHGTSGRRPALMGSVAEKVVREAPCSVFTVRLPRGAAS